MRLQELFQASIIRGRLTEGTLDRVETLLGKKLEDRFNADPSRPDKSKVESAKEIVERIAAADPTPNKEYTFWLARMYLAGWRSPEEIAEFEKYGQNVPPIVGIRRFEDIGSRAGPALAIYQKAKLSKKLPIDLRDINRISFKELEDIVSPLKDQKSNREIKAGAAQKFFDSGAATLIYNDHNISVVVPHTEEASCFFGVNTKWCTAANEDNRFDEYNSEGPLYIVLIKKENERYQFHFGTDQFMDEEDEPVDPIELGKKYPVLKKIFAPIAEKEVSVFFNDNPSYELQKRLMDVDKVKLALLTNVDPKIQKALVEKDPYYIRLIMHPTQHVQDFVVKHAPPSEIRYMRNPSDETIKAVILKYGRKYCGPDWLKRPGMMEFVAKHDDELLDSMSSDRQPEPVKMAAVSAFPEVIRFLDAPSEQVQVAAVSKNPSVIKLIRNPCPKAMEIARQSHAA